MTNTIETYKVLSIDAWGNADEGFEWNQWFNAGTIDLENLDNDLGILGAMVDAGFITTVKAGDIEDDGYNVVIVDKQTREPLFAIVYGDKF
jgi:hypothetical protein